MLITKDQIKSQRPLSDSIKDKEINQFIEDAELMDLRPLLGERLYQDLSANPSKTTNGSYPDLLDGSTYTYGGDSYTHPGLKKILADFAYARYRLLGDVKPTAHGHITHRFQEGTPETDESKRVAYNAVRKVAKYNWAIVKLFLDRNPSSYTLWRSQAQQFDNDENYTNINKSTLD